MRGRVKRNVISGASVWLFCHGSFRALALAPGEQHGTNWGILIGALVAAMLVTIVLAYRLLRERRQRRILAGTCQRAVKLMSVHEQQYRRVLSRQQQLRAYRHDMVNHLIAITGLLKQGQYDRLQDYVEDIRDPVTLGGALVSTGSLTLDALLSEKRALAAAKKVRLEHSILLNVKNGLPLIFLDLFLNVGLEHAIRTAGEQTGSGEEHWVDLELSEKQSVLMGRLRFTCPARKNTEKGQRLLRPLLQEATRAGGAWNVARENTVVQIEVSLPAGQTEQGRAAKSQALLLAPEWLVIGGDACGEGHTL